MKLKNIDWKQLGINAGFAVSFTMTAGIIAAVLTAPTPKPGPTIEEQLKVIQANQQTMTQFLVQNHNRLNKRVDLLEQRQDGMLPLPTKEER